jgi:hypothetical protein
MSRVTGLLSLPTELHYQIAGKAGFNNIFQRYHTFRSVCKYFRSSVLPQQESIYHRVHQFMNKYKCDFEMNDLINCTEKTATIGDTMFHNSEEELTDDIYYSCYQDFTDICIKSGNWLGFVSLCAYCRYYEYGELHTYQNLVTASSCDNSTMFLFALVCYATWKCHKPEEYISWNSLVKISAHNVLVRDFLFEHKELKKYIDRSTSTNDAKAARVDFKIYLLQIVSDMGLLEQFKSIPCFPKMRY